MMEIKREHKAGLELFASIHGNDLDSMLCEDLDKMIAQASAAPEQEPVAGDPPGSFAKHMEYMERCRQQQKTIDGMNATHWEAVQKLEAATQRADAAERNLGEAVGLLRNPSQRMLRAGARAVMRTYTSSANARFSTDDLRTASAAFSAMAEALLSASAEPAKPRAQEDHDPHWRDMATAPRDGTMLRLLVEFTEHPTEDAQQAPTIGANNFYNDGEDRWQFAGWCWSHDHFTQGEGEPIGWLPMLNDPVCGPAKGGDGEVQL